MGDAVPTSHENQNFESMIRVADITGKKWPISGENFLGMVLQWRFVLGHRYDLSL
jgi:hypothetical protein